MAEMASSAGNPLGSLPDLQETLGRKYVTLRQFCRLLGVTYHTGLRYIRDKKVHAVKVGGSWRIYEEELTRFLNQGNLSG